MADVKSKSITTPLFLREEELRYSLELLFFAYRDFTAEADAVLEQYGFGRAHHRTIYFIGRNPGLNIGELLEILNITKQSLARVLGTLVDEGFVDIAHGRADRRQRHLDLTEKGRTLEAELTAIQKRRFSRAYREAGFDAVDGFLAVMQNMLDEPTRAMLKPRAPRP